ncbi:hypothetical protein ACP8Y2_08025 [Herpetosiphon llansteffanensis]
MLWRSLLACCLGLILLIFAVQIFVQAFEYDYSVTPNVAKGYIAVFSGMPDPQWSLDSNDVAYIQYVLETAPNVAPPTEVPSSGYRGMNLDLLTTDIPTQLTIFNEVITLRQAGTTRYLSDPNRELERWLLEDIRGDIAPGSYDFVKSKIP